MQYALNVIHLTALGSQILLSDTSTHIGNATHYRILCAAHAVTGTMYAEEGTRRLLE